MDIQKFANSYKEMFRPIIGVDYVRYETKLPVQVSEDINKHIAEHGYNLIATPFPRNGMVLVTIPKINSLNNVEQFQQAFNEK